MALNALSAVLALPPATLSRSFAESSGGPCTPCSSASGSALAVTLAVGSRSLLPVMFNSSGKKRTIGWPVAGHAFVDSPREAGQWSSGFFVRLEVVLEVDAGIQAAADLVSAGNLFHLRLRHLRGAFCGRLQQRIGIGFVLGAGGIGSVLRFCHDPTPPTRRCGKFIRSRVPQQ